MSTKRTPCWIHGLKIFTPTEPVRHGVLGPVVVNFATGRICSLVPQHLTEQGVFLKSQREIVHEEPLVFGVRNSRSQLCENLISVLPLPPKPIDIAIYDDSNFLQRNARRIIKDPAIIRNVADFGGEIVHLSGTTGRPPMRIRSADSQFEIRNGVNDEPTLYDLAIELEFPFGESPLDAKDMGSLVLSDSGDWIGVIVAIAHDVAFAAPIANVAAAHGLGVIAKNDLLKHNREFYGKTSTVVPVSTQVDTPEDFPERYKGDVVRVRRAYA